MKNKTPFDDTYCLLAGMSRRREGEYFPQHEFAELDEPAAALIEPEPTVSPQRGRITTWVILTLTILVPLIRGV
jgi:hypothetical protein